MKGQYEIPNRDYLEFAYCKLTPTGRGLNQQVTLENLGNGCFSYTESRVGIAIGVYRPKSHLCPMTRWNDTVCGLLKRGFILTKKEKMDKKEIKKNVMTDDSGSYSIIEDISVRTIVERIIGFANKVVSTQYTVKVDDISDEMIDLGRVILRGLTDKVNNNSITIGNFNAELTRLFAAIPRRMDNLSKYLAKDEKDIPDILQAEHELYDVLISQLRDDKRTDIIGKTILEAKDIEMRHVTKDEEEYLRKKLGVEGHRYVDAWKVINHRTQKAFDEFCKRENLTEGNGIDHLFHGSRNENWWSILTTGLTCTPPTGVVICGKAFGLGIYTAPDACKSMGYTSRSGSRWANGSSNTGFLLVNQVATGKRYDARYGIDTSLTWEKLQKIEPGAHCTWAQRGGAAGFMMDEVIVYRDEQITSEYLIEVGL